MALHIKIYFHRISGFKDREAGEVVVGVISCIRILEMADQRIGQPHLSKQDLSTLVESLTLLRSDVLCCRRFVISNVPTSYVLTNIMYETATFRADYSVLDIFSKLMRYVLTSILCYGLIM